MDVCVLGWSLFLCLCECYGNCFLYMRCGVHVRAGHFCWLVTFTSDTRRLYIHYIYIYCIYLQSGCLGNVKLRQEQMSKTMIIHTIHSNLKYYTYIGICGVWLPLTWIDRSNWHQPLINGEQVPTSKALEQLPLRDYKLHANNGWRYTTMYRRIYYLKK